MLKNELQKIINDKTSGASALYLRTINLFLSDNNYQSKKAIKRDLKQIRKSFPEMAPFIYLENQLSRSAKSWESVLNTLKEEADSESQSVLKNLQKIWKKKWRVITFSRSSLVYKALVANKDKIESLIMSVAEPKREGILAARDFSRAGIKKISLMSDAALPGMIGLGDLVIIGADSVFKNYFINKSGTLPLVVTARALGAKVIVLAESFKILAARQSGAKFRSRGKDELVLEMIRGVEILNYYFERIPLEYADYLITGQKLARPGQTRK